MLLVLYEGSLSPLTLTLDNLAPGNEAEREEKIVESRECSSFLNHCYYVVLFDFWGKKHVSQKKLVYLRLIIILMRFWRF